MSSEKEDGGKKGRDSQRSVQDVPTKDTGKFIRKEEHVVVPNKKDSGGTESTGPRKK